jgi:hypothetical protein
MAMQSTEGEAFVMSARLVEISELVADLPLSRVMLAHDARFPWLCSSQGAPICTSSLISAPPSKGC